MSAKEKKDPFGFDAAVKELEKHPEKLERALKESSELARKRAENRILTDEQMRRPFTI